MNHKMPFIDLLNLLMVMLKNESSITCWNVLMSAMEMANCCPEMIIEAILYIDELYQYEGKIYS